MNVKSAAYQRLRYLFLLTTAFLIVFGLSSFRLISQDPNGLVSYALYAFLMFIDAAVLLFCAFQLHRKKKTIFWSAVIFLVFNIVSVLFDQFGVVNLLFILLNSAALIFLILARKEFLPA